MSTYPALYAGQKFTAALFTAGLPQIALKTADESVTSQTTVQNDDQLFLPVESNATYTFTGWLWYTAASTTPDIRLGFAVPSGAQLYRTGLGQINGATTTSGIVDTTVLSAAGQEGRGAFPTALSTVYNGVLTTAGTSGTFQLQWAQVATSADTVILRTGSWIRLDRVS